MTVRRPGTVVVLVFLLLACGLLSAWQSTSSLSAMQWRMGTSFPATGGLSTRWTYDFARDSKDHSLVEDQCNAAFPDLYDHIDYMVVSRRGRLVPQSDLVSGDCLVHVLIYESEVPITHHFLRINS